jgi:hypothetical protein
LDKKRRNPETNKEKLPLEQCVGLREKLDTGIRSEVSKHVNAAVDDVVVVEGNLAGDVAEADILGNVDDPQKSSDVFSARQDDGGQLLEAYLVFHQEIIQSALVARRTLEALQRNFEEVRVGEIPDHIDGDLEDIPVEQTICVERFSLAQKMRQLLESVRQVVEVPRVGPPVVPNRLDEDNQIVKKVTEWFMRKA